MNLFEAVLTNKLEEVAHLIRSGADVNISWNHLAFPGISPLYVASRRGFLEMVILLIESNADVNQASENGWTPLHQACLGQHLDVAFFLMQNGANPNIQDIHGETPLHTATKKGDLDLLLILMDFGGCVSRAVYEIA